MKENIELALIGKGRWGQNYINTIASMEGVNLSPEHIKTRDYADLFDLKDKIAGVIIASPTDTHFSIARDFLMKGFNLLIEKPITRTYQEALELARLHQEHPGTVIMVGHIQIYDPGYQKLKASLAIIGDIQRMTFKGLQSPVRQDATVLENWGPHPIYLFVDLIGKNPTSVTARETINDNLHLDLDFEDQVVGKADIGSVSDEKKRELTVVGKEGSLTLDWSGPVKTLIFTANDGTQNNLSFPGDSSPLALEVLEFVDCIRIGRQPKTPLSQGVEVMKIIDTASLSLSYGKDRI